MATSSTDSSGQPFREVPIGDGLDDVVRVTYIARPSWYGRPTVRIQKRDGTGRTVFGPEFAAERALDLIAAIAELVRENNGSKP